MDAGLTMFTHLGNGCPLQMHRHDNIIQRVLSVSSQLWIGFIAGRRACSFCRTRQLPALCRI